MAALPVPEVMPSDLVPSEEIQISMLESARDSIRIANHRFNLGCTSRDQLVRLLNTDVAKGRGPDKPCQRLLRLRLQRGDLPLVGKRNKCRRSGKPSR